MIRDVGDVARLKLAIDPAGPDTTATIVVTAPDGEHPELNPTTNLERSEWTANLPCTMPGLYEVRWVVTGTGAGSESHTIAVRPAATSGRTYATTRQLAEFLGDAPPLDAVRRLVRATRDVDLALLGARYAVGSDGLPTEPAIRAALADAVCAQVQADLDTNGGDGSDTYQIVKIGSVTLDRGEDTSSSTTTERGLGDDAVRHLRRAGLLPITPLVVG